MTDLSGHPASAGENPAESPQTKAFAYQLDFLKLEFQAINDIIKRLDELAQKNKDYAVLIWAGSLSLGISQVALRGYIWLTAVLPLVFWFVDAQWRHIQRTCIYRMQKISEFLNGPDLQASFEQEKLVNFHIVDPRGIRYKDISEYKKFTGVQRALHFKDVGVFYGGLTFLSLALGLFFALFSS